MTATVDFRPAGQRGVKWHFAVAFGEEGNYGDFGPGSEYCCQIHCASRTACGGNEIQKYLCPNATERYSFNVHDVTCELCLKTFQYKNTVKRRKKMFGPQRW